MLQTTNPPQSPFDKGEAATPSLVKGRVGEGFVVLAIFKSLLIEDRLFKFGIIDKRIEQRKGGWVYFFPNKKMSIQTFFVFSPLEYQIESQPRMTRKSISFLEMFVNIPDDRLGSLCRSNKERFYLLERR